MATTMYMEWPGVTQDQYNRVLSYLEMDANPPKGGIFHVAGFSGGSLRVLDIWESQQDFERFQKDRLAAAVQKAGVTTQPKVEFFPTHNIYTPNIEAVKRLGRTSQPIAA
ncbi:MAG: hypothetical protein HYX72_00530 [Acidobacteria bacterium]|nr:hypothetical protein [Acidobacteriota bacterium]